MYVAFVVFELLARVKDDSVEDSIKGNAKILEVPFLIG
ncbi:MAG: hypothetical protein AOA65_2070 [Candidatus Bathyarchaeota archaeon BA1]|nr:MAG: hypothetical protein AOA65_2070 [Candidatus Bathyarchaeota archaeon BA1]